ncbi:MAG: hypothetical protein EBT26_11270 [Microbacteriaceae bacterium]|nr:hypothetical protein [Microbacteriaceae bacterium]
MTTIHAIKSRLKDLAFRQEAEHRWIKVFPRKGEYWIQVNADDTITFESYQKSYLKYVLKFRDIYEFENFALELLGFSRKAKATA